MSENESRPVVVGVDGSPASEEALRWAVNEARLRGCRVEAVSAWHMDYGMAIGSMSAEIALQLSPENRRAAQQAVLDGAVEEFTGVEISRVLVEGDPRTALTTASRDAQLLVVGSRGHGPIVEAIIGSVSSYCVHHATCPVVVVRAPKPVETETARDERITRIPAPLTPGPLL
ncbi:universal stress protein [Lentzea sp. NEAU-D7]|uniref:universal stress protein n=1 Tax=Lentzea sp. NEAU-D7 TaxID=2994667 RepID=UPI00224AC4AC|nr:universal stress protein [Lentzea sp. NEAU-D7]MCX2953697.1 universal stress protein [Lentzea sp. NEAU-D7]